MLSHALRHALVWIALGVGVAAAWPRGERVAGRVLALVIGAPVAVVMVASDLSVVNVLGPAVLLAAFAIGERGANRRVFLLASLALAFLALYRHANTSIPFVWVASDLVGGGLGRAAELITQRALWVGATFAGLDFLVTMLVLYASWFVIARPRLVRALLALLAIAAFHLSYLCVLSFAPELLAQLGSEGALSGPPRWPPRTVWSWSGTVRTLVPWNMPVIACVGHAIACALMLSATARPSRPQRRFRAPLWRVLAPRFALMLVVAVLSAALPLLTSLSWHRTSLAGKKVVVYEHGFLNWLRPVHDGQYGRYSVGMYGMLPTYIESLGGTCAISPDLCENCLRGADLLVLLYPDKPWRDDQLQRIWTFVMRGGSLLVMGEHTTVMAGSDKNAFNLVLEPTGMQVRFDSATFAVGGWLQSYEALSHPATAGVGDVRNDYGVVIGASVETSWPARPILVGRWGWAVPGDPLNRPRPGDRESGASLMGKEQYEAGHRLGDVVLAAETPLQRGRVIAFGDTSSLTNGITTGAHAFSSRLFAYLASRSGGPHETWRGILGLMVMLALAVFLCWNPRARRIAAFAIAMSLSLVACARWSERTAEVVPDGRGKTPNNLAYVDFSHLNACSPESWREDGTMGLALTLMRDGYLVLDLTELSAKRLRRAGLLVSIAPSREYSNAECEIIREFVRGGGIFICTAGYDAWGPSRSALSEFGLYVGLDPPHAGRAAREPQPMGHFKSPYLQVDQQRLWVRFHAGWPVGCTERGAQVVAWGVGEVPDPQKGTVEHRELPVIIVRGFGKGKVVLVGDTGFAMNKNLEHEDGSPFEGMRENADFWRWFLSSLRGQREWIPPAPVKAGPGAGETGGSVPSTGEAP